MPQTLIRALLLSPSIQLYFKARAGYLATVNVTLTASFTFPEAEQWLSLPDIPVVVESRTGPEKASAVFRLVLDTPAPAPTASPVPTATPYPTAVPAMPASPTATPPCVYAMRYVADVTIPDNTVIPPGIGFVKTWRIVNSGTCSWPAGTNWVFAGDSQMGGPNAVPVPATKPGETADVSVYLIAPGSPVHTPAIGRCARPPAGNQALAVCTC